MAQLVVRNLSEDVKERLKRRATRHGHSLEAEVRLVLSQVPELPPSTVGEPGSWVDEHIRQLEKIGVTEEDVDALNESIAELRRHWRTRELGL